MRRRECIVAVNMDTGENREIERRAFELQATICRALAEPKRLHILHLLEGGERSVGQLAAALDVRQANLSQHLRIMRQAGLVEVRRDGRLMCYRLANPMILEACSIVHEVLLRQLSDRETLSRHLQARHASGQ